MGKTDRPGTLPQSTRLRLLAGLILLCGLGSAALLYANATDAPPEGVSYVMEGGTAYEVLPQDSRAYRRSLEYFGGTSAVLMTELRAWAAGFWRSPLMALLVACATVLAACSCLYAAESPAPGQEPGQDAEAGTQPEMRSGRK